MNQYRWQGLGEAGNYCSGVLAAKSEEQLKELLLEKRIALLYAKKRFIFLSFFKGLSFSRDVLLPRRFKRSVVQLFFQHCGILLSSGVDIITTLKSCALSLDHPKLIECIESMIDLIKQGKRFHEALSVHAERFPAMTVSLIATAEETGTLAELCLYLAESLAQQGELTYKIQKALLSPAFTLMSAFFASGAILIFVVPTLEVTLIQLGAELPPATKRLFVLSTFVRDPKISMSIVGGFVIIAYLLMKSVKSHRFSQYSLHIFFIGKIMQERLSMLFLYLLLLYLKAGASLGQSLLYITEHAESFFIKKRAKDLYDKLILGHSFNEIIKEQADLFSPETRALIQIGMKSGKLQEALEKALDLSKERVQKKVTLLTTLINPLAMIIIALLILGLLLILYMPIFTLSSTPRLSF